MNTLGSPLEALAFNYLSFGFLTVVNNIWAWVAVITAAVSFWRIRAAGGTGSTKSEPRAGNYLDVPPPPMVSTPPVTEEAVADKPAASATTETRRFSWDRAVETTEETTSGKFTVYYDDDDTESELALTGEVDDGGVGGEDWCDDWKRTLRMRMGDMGWYRYQDLTALDGNVVRLWVGCEQKTTISFSGSVMW